MLVQLRTIQLYNDFTMIKAQPIQLSSVTPDVQVYTVSLGELQNKNNVKINWTYFVRTVRLVVIDLQSVG